MSMVCEKRKEKITPVFSYRRDCEPVGLIPITVLRDAIYGFMPPLGRWALMKMVCTICEEKWVQSVEVSVSVHTYLK